VSLSSDYTPQDQRHYIGDKPVVERRKYDDTWFEGKMYPDWKLAYSEGDNTPGDPFDIGYDKMHEDEDGN
jgi:hypothetical protein